MYRDPSKRRLVVRRYRQRKRKDTLERLGGKCARCGFGDWRALQIDHVNGGGTQERQLFKSQQTYVNFVLANNNGRYQILCANCNWIKRYEEYEERKI